MEALSTRISSIDIARGIAILLMINSHLKLALGVPFYFYNYLSFLAAPFFLIISGIGFQLFLSNRLIKNSDYDHILLESFCRALILYFISVLGLYIGSIFWPDIYEFHFFAWSLLQVIAFGYVFGFFLPPGFIPKIITIILVFSLYYVINSSIIPSTFSLLVSGSCPVIPWFAYFIFGCSIHDLYSKRHGIFRGTDVVNYSLIFLIVLCSLSAFNIPFGYNLRDKVPTFLVICSSQLMILSLLNYFVEGKGSFHNIMHPLEKIGRISFTIYYLHIGIIFIIYKILSLVTASTANPYIYAFSLLWIILFFSVMESFWKEYNYVLSIEWIFRRGSKLLYSLSYKYCNKLWEGIR